MNEEIKLTWKQNTVIRILLLVAKLMASEEWAKEIETLKNHIAVGER